MTGGFTAERLVLPDRIPKSFDHQRFVEDRDQLVDILPVEVQERDADQVGKGLIGEAMQVALDAGIDHTAICTEQRGSLVRRMQCVHCKGISENVTTQPSQGAHCGLWLLVRDHYSRRLGAFQGVCIHAEEPDNIPAAVETFV